jgi:hypothetical protein
MSIKLHKVLHCFDSLIFLLYEHPFTICFDIHTVPDDLFWMSSMSGFTNQIPHKKKNTQTQV